MSKKQQSSKLKGVPSKGNLLENTQDNNLISYTFFFTKKQSEKIERLGEKLGAANMITLFDKMLALTEIYGNSLDHNYEMALVDRDEMEVIVQSDENNKNSHVSMYGPEKSLVFVTSQLEEKLGIQKLIKESNNFGFPVDGYEA